MNETTKVYSLRELAVHCRATVNGDASFQIGGVASIGSAKSGDIVFAQDEANLERALQSAASAVVVGTVANDGRYLKPLLVAADPKLAFALIAALFAQRHVREGRDESANIHISAQIGDGAWVGPGVVIEENVLVGNRTSIGANSVIESGVRIGEDCRIGPNVIIHSGTSIKSRVVVQAGSVLGSTGFGYVRDENGRYHLFPQQGSLILEDDVEVGANCTIDRGALDTTIVRRGTKLDNMVHVGHNVEIGEDVVIAAQTGISGSSRIGNGAIVGGQVGIADHVDVEGGVILGAQSGIPSNKTIRGKGIVFWGTPARPIKAYLRDLATLSRLTKKSGK